MEAIFKTLFILQADENGDTSDEVEDFARLLKSSHLKREYRHLMSTTNDMEDNVKRAVKLIGDDMKDSMNYIIPVGDLGFVQKFLRDYYNVNKINPIEIPKSMRTNENLKRQYAILPKESVRTGTYLFIKDASTLKNYATCTTVSKELLDDIGSDVYVVSEYVEFAAEYRVLVLNGVIECINYYAGEVTVLPDISTIKRVVHEYFNIPNHSRAVAIDFGVTKSGDTVLIEIHTFVSCGTYGYRDSKLAYMYRFGFEYARDVNTPIETCVGNINALER